MSSNAGLWIDHRQAVVVFLTVAGEDIKHFTSSHESHSRQPGGVQEPHAYTPNDFVAEDKRERKDTIQHNNFYDEVIASLHDAEKILVLGPGEAKGEFVKRLEGAKQKGRVAEVQTADKMTEGQIAAHVRQHFAPQAKK